MIILKNKTNHKTNNSQFKIKVKKFHKNKAKIKPQKKKLLK